MTETAALDYAHLLDAVADGVLTVGPDSRIMTLNPAGAAMLGVKREEALGQTLAFALAEQEDADAFLDAVLCPLQPEAPQGRRVVSFGDRRLSVESRVWRPEHGPFVGRPALTTAFSDVTETERLQAELAEQHRRLQDAFVELERKAEAERRFSRRVGLLRTGAIASVLAAVLGVAAWTFLSPAAAPEEIALTAPGGVVTMAAQAQPVAQRIAVVGALEPGANVSVVGPYDGTVRERLFRYGGSVERGEVLLRMDRNELESRIREARAAEIRARAKVEELRSWSTGFEVARARRQLAAAELETGNLRARIGQSQMLLSRGIIPAEEHRNLLQQARNQDLQLEAARQDLASTLARGDATQLATAELELLNAEGKLRDLEQDLAQAEVRAPVSGVVLMPPERQGAGGGGGGGPQTVEAGSRVSRGQTMFTIGDLETFMVRGQVDEIDVNQVRPGQNVVVTGDAFAETPLRGRVASVAAQASSEGRGMGMGSGMPSFAVSVIVDGLTPEQRQRLAVGMSASLSIVVHERQEAVVLPPQAIRTENGQRVVRVRDGARFVSRPVTLGITIPEGIEIREGISPGDVIVLRE
ncbi:HlyD family efflux transporter periplasmic adaptor subunit [Sabulicella rubraurantiaca]|uniref:HlyD family efflux transporter periplasmic adaptor subunit n=1 Tax=Sabulicella rubraurantiaca TaxID=2811429 RepID=UPI001A973941|nr:HlyD family efflux transporter periplasmic adaptor subunit [Sabulicella rubraurantiaca]